MNTPTENIVEILGVKVLRRTLFCVEGLTGVRPGFKLVVHVTDACPCSCNFCCNQSKGFSLDVEQFKRDYEVIKNAVPIEDVLFTGGEPMLYWDKIKECATVIDAPITVHTAGVNLDKIDDPRMYVSLSRHHHDHEENEKILKTKLPRNYIKDFQFKKRMNIACNIIKGHVDNPTDMRKVLDFAMENGIPHVGFVGLMPINDYSKENGIPIPVLEGDDVLPYKSFKLSSGGCDCHNYCYHKNGEFQMFYTRHTTCPGTNLGGRIIYKNGIQPWYTK